MNVTLLRKWHLSLFAVSIFLTLSLSVSANAGVFSLINDCRALLLATGKPLPKQPVQLNLPPSVWVELKSARDMALQNLEKRTHNFDGERISETFEMNQQQYNFVRYLGAGGEAHVYLVEKDGTQFVFKQFGTWPISKNLSWARTLRLRGHNIVEAVEVNRKRKAALYPFVDGITMYYFYYNESSQMMKYISPETQDLVRKQFEEFREKFYPGFEFKTAATATIPHNVILDFNSKQFVIIDPH